MEGAIPLKNTNFPSPEPINILVLISVAMDHNVLMSAVTQGQRGYWSPGAGATGCCEPPWWVLVIEFGSSERAAGTQLLNHLSCPLFCGVINLHMSLQLLTPTLI